MVTPSTPPVADPPGGSLPAARLHVVTSGLGPRVVLAHGFTQTGRLWGPLADGLAADHQVLRVDLPGHGASGDLRVDLAGGATLLGRAGGTGAYLGYSMGARFCLHLALAAPDQVQSLVLISGTAGIEDAGERAARVASDAALADQLDPPGGDPADAPARLDAFLGRWLADPMFAGVPVAAAGLEERRRNHADGLAWSLRLAGTGTQLPLWHRLGQLAMPVLVVTGGHDTKFTGLGRRLAGAIGENAVHVVVPGVGHSAHLEDPATVIGLVRDHLAG